MARYLVKCSAEAIPQIEKLAKINYRSKCTDLVTIEADQGVAEKLRGIEGVREVREARQGTLI